jgi:hypothetical protein
MSHGRIRGYRPPVAPLTRKPGDSQSAPGKVEIKQARGGTLGPGQHLTLPARTGLAHYRDHFDARERPDYEARLKGETKPPSEQPATPQAGQSNFDPSVLVRPRPVEAEEEEPLEDESKESGSEPEPFERVTCELQGGLFTLAEGSLDAHRHPLCTLEAFLDGDVPHISVAVDLDSIPYGTPLSIRALDAHFGRPLPFRAVSETERTAKAKRSYLEICVSSDDPAMVAALDRRLAVTLG